MCEEARCPNIGECWGGGSGDLALGDEAAKRKATATIMARMTDLRHRSHHSSPCSSWVIHAREAVDFAL